MCEMSHILASEAHRLKLFGIIIKQKTAYSLTQTIYRIPVRRPLYTSATNEPVGVSSMIARMDGGQAGDIF